MLAAAEAEFADRGFEAATMDQIAGRAGVSKSHLYYHFDSKDDLLEQLFAVRVAEILADKEELFADAPVLDDGLVDRVLRQGVASLLATHPDFLRIAVLECFRPGGRSDLAFRFLSGVTDDTLARFRAYGLNPDRAELQAAMTWFGLLPILAELLVGADRARILGLDVEREHGIFQCLLGEVYRGYLAQLRAVKTEEADDAPRG